MSGRTMLKIAAFLLLASLTFAEPKGKENVKALVRKEIHQAIGLEKVHSASSAKNAVLLKFLIITTAGIAAFGYVFYRRKKLGEGSNSNLLKSKIELIKKEKLVYRMDPKLRIVRNKLLETVSPNSLKYETIKEHAKRLNIGQEEILLAARLNLYKSKNNIAKNNFGGSIA